MTTADVDSLVESIHREVVESAVDGRLIRPHASRLVVEAAPLAHPGIHDLVVDRVMARVEGLGPLEPLLRDPAVSEVMVNGPGPVWVERAGKLSATEVWVDRDEVDRLVERIVAPLGRRIDRRVPWVDGRLDDGSRVNVIAPPVALDGPCITIRRFVLREVALASFAADPVVALLGSAVGQGLNILVSGGTGAGKTTLLNALAGRVDPGERIVTVEDAAELRLPHPHVVRLEARPESPEGGGAVTIRDLVRNALRMRPDRLVVGEVRGSEALDLVQALNTGHSGCLSTIHANGPADALRRLEMLALTAAESVPLVALRDQVAAAVDLVVQVARAGDRRRITHVAEVTGPGEVVELARHGKPAGPVQRLSRPSRRG